MSPEPWVTNTVHPRRATPPPTTTLNQSEARKVRQRVQSFIRLRKQRNKKLSRDDENFAFFPPSKCRQLGKEIDNVVTSGDAGITHECLASMKSLVLGDPVHAPNVAIETLLHHLKVSHSQVIRNKYCVGSRHEHDQDCLCVSIFVDVCARMHACPLVPM